MDNDAKNIPLETALTEIFPGEENWSHLSQQGGRQRRQAPHHADPPCNELAQLERGSSEDVCVAQELMRCYNFSDSNDVPSVVLNDTNSAWPVLNSCACPLNEKKSHLGKDERKLQKAMENVTGARAGVHVFMVEFLARFEFAKATTNNPSLEFIELLWWHALITLLVFSDHDATGPASAKPCRKKMLAKVGTKMCEFDFEKDMANVMEFVSWNVQEAHEDLKEIESKLYGEEKLRRSPRDDFQKALSLVREKLLIARVLFAFVSRINPDVEECKRRSSCLELLEEAFRLCIGMQGAEVYYKFNDTVARPNAFVTLSRTAVMVRCLYGSLVEDSEVRVRVMSMAFRDIDALALCCPEDNQLSEFNKLGMCFLKEKLLVSQQHTELSSVVEKRKVHAKAAETRRKPGAALEATQPSNLLAQPECGTNKLTTVFSNKPEYDGLGQDA